MVMLLGETKLNKNKSLNFIELWFTNFLLKVARDIEYLSFFRSLLDGSVIYILEMIPGAESKSNGETSESSQLWIAWLNRNR